MKDYERIASDMGAQAGYAAGTWAADGNTDPDHARHLLALLREGSPMAYDYLPAMPDLSGEMAGGETPAALAAACGIDAESDELEHACELWEAACASMFDATCERELMAAAGEDGE